MSIRVRFVGIATSLLLALVSLAGPLAAPAMAGYTTLCWGYQGCSEMGMTAAGYAQVSKTMYWRMYAGHNCTNYAAYRMIKSGLPNSRPWEGSGNAENWGLAMAHITDQTPTVGAVAWWKQNVWPAGSAGHVAYVEKVVSPTEIIVSQDSWGGDFSWARITKDGKGWPNGFVHFNDINLTNSAVPVVSGEAKVGSTLTATPGSWSKPDVLLTYEWLADGVALDGATLSTYSPVRSDLGKALTVRVTASKLGFASTTATSLPTAAVSLGLLRADTSPAVTGEPVVDKTLEVAPVTWSPEPARVKYAWWADGVRIDEAVGSMTLDLAPELVDKNITVTATARRPGFEPLRLTTAVPTPVAPGTLTTTPSTLTGTPRLGETLKVKLGTAAPTATKTVTWLRSGVPIEGAGGSTYTLTAADLGQRISPQVTHERPGYTTVVDPTSATELVRSVTTMKLEVVPGGKRGRAKVAASFAAPGVAPVTGTAYIRSGGTLLAEVALVDGVARKTVRGLDAGKHRIKVVYKGSPSTTWVKAVQPVVVR
ncbi:MAG TPA: CHAP domain-containing protein [Nocardioidaceae bacterium]|nr:CHAP domain-containing protein [Nocardioidaceae bacterium]